MVEQRTENSCVIGSIPIEATNLLNSRKEVVNLESEFTHIGCRSGIAAEAYGFRGHFQNVGVLLLLLARACHHAQCRQHGAQDICFLLHDWFYVAFVLFRHTKICYVADKLFCPLAFFSIAEGKRTRY